MVSFTFRPLPPGKKPNIDCIRDWVCPRAGLDDLERIKKNLAPTASITCPVTLLGLYFNMPRAYLTYCRTIQRGEGGGGGEKSCMGVPHRRKCWGFFTIQFIPAFLSHAGSRKERLCLACLKAGTWGPSTRAIRWRLQVPCLLSSPVMSCSESTALIDDADRDQYGVGRRYSHCRRQLAHATRLVTHLSRRRPGLVPRLVHVGFMVEKVTLGKGFLCVLWPSPASTTPH